MADVTVNIRGDASQLRNELDGVGRQTGTNSTASHSSENNFSNNRTASTPNDRMIEDVRREMRQRGVVMVPGSTSMMQLINQYGQSQRQVVNDRIEEKYNTRREDMRSRMSADYDMIDQDVENQRNTRLGLLSNPNDPLVIAAINQQMNSYRDQQYKMVGQRYDKEEEQINQDEAEEKSRTEEELTLAIKQLTEYFERQSEANGGTDNSFIGQLKQKQRALIQERDTAATEEGAMDASRRLADVNEQLRRTMSGGSGKQGDNLGMKTLGMISGATGISSSIQGGDLGGALVGGAMMTGNPYVITAAVMAKAIQSAAMGGLDQTKALVSIATMNSANQYRDRDGLLATEKQLYKSQYDPRDINVGYEDFTKRAVQVTKARGTADNWVPSTYEAMAIEKRFAMDEGSLNSGMRYDRYGINTTDALVDLVTLLNDLTAKGFNTGVSENNFARVQEKYDLQQRVMASYGTRTPAPSYEDANRLVAGFSAVQGVPQDERLGDHIASFQNAIQNPMNDRARAMLYSTVYDQFAGTGEINGMRDIDRMIKDPEKEPEIIQAFIQNVAKTYGDPRKSDVGYFSMQHLFKGIDPKSMDAYVDAAMNGTLAQDVKRGKVKKLDLFDEHGNLNGNTKSGQNKQEYISSVEKYLPKLEEGVRRISDFMPKILNGITNRKDYELPKENVTKSGGYR